MKTIRLSDKKGLVGISALIILVAIILIAALAAGLLMIKGSDLRVVALKKKMDVERALESSIEIISIVGSDGSDGDIEAFEIIMKMTSGEDPVSFNDTILIASTTAWSQDMLYNGSGTTSSGTSVFFVEYLRQGVNYREHGINWDDLVKIRFSAESSLPESKKMKIKFIIKNGQPAIAECTTPARVKDTKVNLYPLAINV